MPVIAFRSALALLFLVVLAALGHPEEPMPLVEPPPGQLLVASAAMQDPRFRHSVILLLRHDRTGAFGVVINHPIAERPLAELLAAADNTGAGGGNDQDDKIEGTIRVFLGGPVQPQLGFVIHSTDYRRPDTLVVGEQLAMTANNRVLRDIAHHQGPAKYLFAVGYAGWGAGQLEGEIARRDWFTAPAEPELVFDADRNAVWDKALARRTHEL
jgi:putative transcriptional regulator